METRYSREVMWGLKPYTTIEHHGVPGQRWGIRRTLAQLGHLVKTGYKKASSSLKTGYKKASSSLKEANDKRKKKIAEKKAAAAAEKPKSLQEMSDAEIRKCIDRMQLEKQYKGLYRELHPKQIAAGEKFMKSAKSVLGESMKNIGGQTATYIMGQEMNKLLKKAYPNDSRPIDPKKGQGGGKK